MPTSHSHRRKRADCSCVKHGVPFAIRHVSDVLAGLPEIAHPEIVIKKHGLAPGNVLHLILYETQKHLPVPNPAEVASIHHVSFSELNRPDSPVFFNIPESARPVIRLLVEDSFVHAPTAAVMYQFREVCIHGRHTRVDHLEQPVFAWK